MTSTRQHRSWIIMGAIGLMLLGAAVPFFTARRDAAQEETSALLAANAAGLRTLRLLQQDMREEAALRRTLGEKAYQALFTPPPRAQLVADFRRIGLETGLSDFALEMSEASWLQNGQTPRPSEDLLATLLTVKASAANDRNIYDFAARALTQLPGYIRLDKLTLRRRTGDTGDTVLIDAELQMRWLTLPEDLQFVRQPPP